jgi:hypothetical protein
VAFDATSAAFCASVAATRSRVAAASAGVTAAALATGATPAALAAALGLGAGFQFDFTQNIGLRVGYNFHSFGDSEVFGLNLDPGSMNGITSSLIFKF